ncbi:MAG: hypothetical protein RL329_39 [Bacteroidota bacterium]|jgi:hypothetical protein
MNLFYTDFIQIHKIVTVAYCFKLTYLRNKISLIVCYFRTYSLLLPAEIKQEQQNLLFFLFWIPKKDALSVSFLTYNFKNNLFYT